MEVNSLYKKNFESCEQKIINIYKTYLNDITPFIILIETVDSTYPSEIMNEIRAVFTHLGRYYEFIGNNNNIVNETIINNLEAQVGLAERHIKRAILDCYKYACLSFSDKFIKFDTDCKGIDLSYVANGTFIKELRRLRKEAFEAYQHAKQADTKGFILIEDISIDTYDVSIIDDEYLTYCKFICDDSLFQLYETAYLKYSECNDLIEKYNDDIDFIKRKASKKDIISYVSLGIGILGILVSIVMAIITL